MTGIVDWIKKYFVENGPDCNAIVGISGGKDSSIVAALCVQALGKDRVIGVKMPQGEQYDIDMSNKLIEFLGIKSVEVNIGETCESLYRAISYGDCTENKQVLSNTPARIRMTTLYAVAALYNGRVANTCNRSEDYIGYSTKFGDSAGDFSPLSNLTVTEVLKLGKTLGLPDDLLFKTPEDGLSGLTDEENFGFSYEVLDNFITKRKVPDFDTFNKIATLHKRNLHKIIKMPCYHPRDGLDGWNNF